MLSSYHL